MDNKKNEELKIHGINYTNCGLSADLVELIDNHYGKKQMIIKLGKKDNKKNYMKYKIKLTNKSNQMFI